MESNKSTGKPFVRTKKSIEKVKSKVISCRLTPSEYAFIDSNQLKLRDMVRAFIDGKKTIRNETKESLELRKKQHQIISNIANNLNQVARALNEICNRPEMTNEVNNDTLGMIYQIIENTKAEIKKDILHNKTTQEQKIKALNTFKNDPDFQEILDNDRIDKIIDILEKQNKEVEEKDLK